MPTTRFTPVVTTVALAGSLLACNAPEDLDFSERESEASVGTYTTSSCSTSTVLGLSKQIADEISCMNPNGMVSFRPTGNLVFSSNAVLPYLSAAGKADLMRVASSRRVQVNSGFRTVAQQYLLYRWRQTGRCGIGAAATPGRSNHESGRALDLQNWSSVLSSMKANGWSHSVPGDDVHFDHLASADLRGRDVLAFQRLWNRNNSDKLKEDGVYGPATEAKLRAAPAQGFTRGPICGSSLATGAEVVAIDGPDKVAPGARATYRVELVNNTAADWPETAKLVVAGDSDLHDPQSWATDTEIGELGLVFPAGGGKGSIEVSILAPQVTEETAFNLQMEIVDAGQTRGTVDLALTVTPNGDEGTSGEADDENDEGADLSGGCSTGTSSASMLGFLLPLLAVLRRRRR